MYATPNPTFSARNPSPSRKPSFDQQQSSQPGRRSDSISRQPKIKAPYADNPSEGLIPLPATEILVKRISGWTIIVRNLIRYLEIVMEQERKLAESLARCSKELSSGDDTDALNIFANDESVQTLLKGVNEAQTKLAKDRTQSADMIQNQVLPILRELLSEIKKKVTETDKEWGPFDRDLKQDLDTYIKLASHVRNSLMRQQWKGDAGIPPPDVPKDVPKDPWIADLALRKHIAACAKKQEYYRKKLIEQQESFASFEKVVIQNIRVSLSTFYEWRSQIFSLQLDQMRERKSQIETVNADEDWALFKSSFCDRLIESDAPLIKEKDLTYDGFDDPSVKIVRQAPLHRKEGVFKRSYRPCTGILTASSYLHIVPPIQNGDSFPETPELSLDLTECSLVPLMMNEKDPEEVAIAEKAGGMFGREIKHKFKGVTMADSAEWWGVLNETIRNTAKRAFATALKDADSGQTPKTPEIQPPSLVPPVHGKTASQRSSVKNNDNIPPLPPPSPKKNVGLGLNPKKSLLDKSIEDLPKQQPPVSPTAQTAGDSNTFANFSNAAFVNTTPTQSIPSFAENEYDEMRGRSMTGRPNPLVGISDGFSSNSASSLPISVQMELALKSAVKEDLPADSSLSPSTITPQFDTLDTVVPKTTGLGVPSNPWDTFEDDGAGW